MVPCAEEIFYRLTEKISKTSTNFKMAVKVVILCVLLVLCGVVQCLKPSFQRNTYVMMAANDLIAAGTFLVQ